jgi:predicted alpha/beta superfamily hydrolase
MTRLATFTLLFIICSLPASGQPSQQIVPLEGHVYDLFNISLCDTVYNGNPYRLYIAEAKAPGAKRPVLYMLDGNGQFPVMLNQLTETPENFPLIVAIGYPEARAYPKERVRDYTIAVEGDEEGGGGAEPFYRFICETVKPFVEKTYRVDTARQTLCGHSHGGLFVLYVAFRHTSAFRHYLAASPSLWWGNGKIVPTSRPLFPSPPQSITITLGEYEENPSLDTSPQRTIPDRIKRQRQSDISARDLFRLIAGESPNARFILYEGKTHGGSIPGFLQEAIRIAADNNAAE